MVMEMRKMGQPYRVLVVDDEPEVRELTTSTLSQHDMHCDEAADGVEAIALCNAHAYDAVVTDLRMPNRHGHWLACELLSREHHPLLYVVTGLNEPRLARELESRGVDHIAYKPLDCDTLARQLRESLDERVVASFEEANTIENSDDPRQLLYRIEKYLIGISEGFEERLQGLFDLDHPPPAPPKAINDFIERLEQEELDNPSPAWTEKQLRRTTKRVVVQATAIAVPLDEHFRPAEDSFSVALRDLSEGGVRMLHTRNVSSPYLALHWKCGTFPNRSLGLVIRVTRCRSLSRFYDVGGQFLLQDGTVE